MNVLCVSLCKRVWKISVLQKKFLCVCVCVCLCCTSPANRNSSVASEQEERGSLKTQIQQLHNQQFCSSQNPRCYEHTPPSFLIFFSLPRLAECWQSPPIILFSSHSNSSSQLSSLVPRPTHCLTPPPPPSSFICSPGPCHLLLTLIKQFLLLFPHHHPSFTSNFTYSRTTNQEY